MTTVPRPTRRQLKRAGIIVLALLAVTSVAVGVRVADPFAPQSGPPDLAAADSPEAMAYAAMRSTETNSYVRDYTYRTAEGAEVPLIYKLNIRFDGPDNQISVTRTPNNTVYLNPYYAWVNESGRVTRESPPRESLDPFIHEQRVLTCNCVNVDRRTHDRVYLSIHSDKWANGFRRGAFRDPNGNATLTLVIDSDESVLRRSRFSLVVPDRTNGSTGQYEYTRIDEYSAWGRTEVARPGWAWYSIEEFLADLRNEERGPWVGDPD